jgi:hypothetical protein
MLIDCHTHASRSRAVPRASGSDYPLVEELIAKLDFYEIDRAVLLSGVAPEARSRFVPPRTSSRCTSAIPDRLIPFCSLDPRAGRNSVEEDFRRFLRIYREMGCRGVGETTCNLPDRRPARVEHVLAACADEGMPVTIHIGSGASAAATDSTTNSACRGWRGPCGSSPTSSSSATHSRSGPRSTRGCHAGDAQQVPV